MTALSLPLPAALPTSPITELRRRQPALATAGLAFLLLALVTATLPIADGRTLDGVSVWAKPAKFFLSSGVFMLTSAWFFGFVRPERRKARRLVASAWILIGAATFELAYISFQAAQGLRSHFNVADTFHDVMYALMGMGATAMLLTKIPLAIEIFRRPADGPDPVLRRAVVLGLWLTITLGLVSGVYMSQQYGQGHNVGAVGGAAPLFGWNRLGGDLRVAHFFGMHGEQILPAVAWATTGLAAATRNRVVILAAGGVALFTLAVFAQAVAGLPFLG